MSSGNAVRSVDSVDSVAAAAAAADDTNRRKMNFFGRLLSTLQFLNLL